MTRIYGGTSSWSQHTNFYPKGLRSSEQIAYYAQHFPVVEVNSTFYRMMPQRNFRLWAERTPEGFIFDVKPFRQLTWHDRKNPPDEEVTETFRESLQPLRDAGKLGGALPVSALVRVPPAQRRLHQESPADLQRGQAGCRGPPPELAGRRPRTPSARLPARQPHQPRRRSGRRHGRARSRDPSMPSQWRSRGRPQPPTWRTAMRHTALAPVTCH